jgi:hypothetical protein
MAPRGRSRGPSAFSHVAPAPMQQPPGRPTPQRPSAAPRKVGKRWIGAPSHNILSLCGRHTRPRRMSSAAASSRTLSHVDKSNGLLGRRRQALERRLVPCEINKSVVLCVTHPIPVVNTATADRKEGISTEQKIVHSRETSRRTYALLQTFIRPRMTQHTPETLQRGGKPLDIDPLLSSQTQRTQLTNQTSFTIPFHSEHEGRSDVVRMGGGVPCASALLPLRPCQRASLSHVHQPTDRRRPCSS